MSDEVNYDEVNGHPPGVLRTIATVLDALQETYPKDLCFIGKLAVKYGDNQEWEHGFITSTDCGIWVYVATEPKQVEP